MELEKNSFDYDVLDDGAKIVVQQKTSEIRSRMNKAATNIMEIGERLIAVKDQLGHGHFLDWLEAEFDWTQQTANNMMRVAKMFKLPNFSDLPIGPSALYLLASDSTPEEVRERFIEQAKEGEPVTHAEVKVAVRPVVVSKEEYESGGEVDGPRHIGKGIQLAHDAIAVLRRIPLNDALRDAGLETVAQWIKTNK